MTMTTQDRPKILITGVGGMLGTDLAKALKGDFEIVGLEKRRVTHLTVPHDLCDLTQARKTRDAILDHRPAVVIHTAALTDVDYCEEHHEEALEHNFEATKNIVDASHEIDAPVIFYSTDYVFRGSKKGEYLETDVPDPVNFYGETKLRAERYLMEKASRALIFRITWLFGVYGRCFPKAILCQAAEVKKMTVVNDQTGRPTYTRDVAQAMRQLLLAKKEVVFARDRQIFHLGNSGTVNWADFARFIVKESGLDQVKVEDIPSTQLTRPAPRPLNSVLSLEKSGSVLGLQLRSWEEAAREFLSEWKEEKLALESKQTAEAAAKENEP
ncbi:MAG TPA: dTDP-4-dehydrorhamnose reductase [Candidatus Omnitrophota bacterium]|nr:dTDP-4-dehydrorhamnose reductase [Candidatus Omnitrophota bacterium]